MPTVDLKQGDALDILPTIETGSIDATICDPPYPCIRRPYGTWTEAEWFGLMRGVVPEVMRCLKPHGSAVFILQPNSERVGRMRTWLWEFMAWVGREWGIVQDAWWWNFTAPPMTKNDPNLLRSSVKACVWVGPADCYRDGASVRWTEADASRARRESARLGTELKYGCGGKTTFREASARTACVANGGVTAFNVIPAGADGKDGTVKHAARTPLVVADFWTRYICPPGGTVLDPFAGSGTMGLAALRRGRSFVGVERKPEYYEIARNRLDAELARAPLFA